MLPAGTGGNHFAYIHPRGGGRSHYVSSIAGIQNRNSMKMHLFTRTLLAAACAIALQGAAVHAQDATTTTVITSDGVVQQLVPASSEIMFLSPGSVTPVKYTFNKTTTFVDAAGNTVTYESIKQNTPARIYYTKVGDSYVVTKFMVTEAPAVRKTEETTTTTTTTPD
ncbi:MAG TPA: hypothetical protein VIS74_01800 [Chthoniobacterales bacterium]